jgi:hypothetical protein
MFLYDSYCLLPFFVIIAYMAENNSESKGLYDFDLVQNCLSLYLLQEIWDNYCSRQV